MTTPQALAAATNALDEEAFQALYGRWDPLEPTAIAQLLASAPVRWHIAGGRAARVGAAPRRHEDTDLVVLAEDLTEFRAAMADWHLWENHGGMIRPLLPGTELAAGRDQLWARRDAYHPWQLDILLDPSGDEWVFKRDVSVRLPWDRAVQTVAGVNYLRPEVALLYKAQMDRPKDRDDLAAAAIDPAGREWLAVTLDRLGYDAWARLARNDPR